MALKDYYMELGKRSTPQKEFRDLISKECGVAPITVFRWLSGDIIPDKLKREKIALICNLPIEELFPNTSNNNGTKRI